jgi:hypothetical protein
MAGHRRAEATPFFGRLCPAMTVRGIGIPHPPRARERELNPSVQAIALARTGEFPQALQLDSICPVPFEKVSALLGKSRMSAMRKLPVVLFCRRQHTLRRSPDTPHIAVVPRPQEGRFAIVTDVGCGMRWTRWRRKTSGAGADGEVVWS